MIFNVTKQNKSWRTEKSTIDRNIDFFCYPFGLFSALWEHCRQERKQERTCFRLWRSDLERKCRVSFLLIRFSVFSINVRMNFHRREISQRGKTFFEHLECSIDERISSSSSFFNETRKHFSSICSFGFDAENRHSDRDKSIELSEKDQLLDERSMPNDETRQFDPSTKQCRFSQIEFTQKSQLANPKMKMNFGQCSRE